MKDADRLRALQKRKKTDRVPFYPDRYVRNRSLAWTASAVSPSSSASPRPAASSAPPGPSASAPRRWATRSITLTAEGSLFLERSRRILAEIEATELELSQSRETPRGRLRVSLPLVSGLVLPTLADFMQAYPDIELDLDFSDRVVDVVDEGFDVVLRTGQPVDSRLSMRELGEFQLKLVGSPAYFARHGTPRCPEDLLRHTCLHYRFPNTGRLEEWPLRRADGEAPPQIPVSMVCNNIETRVCFALRDQGIACLPDFSIREALREGRLVSVLDTFCERRARFFLLWPSGRQVSPKLRAFIDFVAPRVIAMLG